MTYADGRIGGIPGPPERRPTGRRRLVRVDLERVRELLDAGTATDEEKATILAGLRREPSLIGPYIELAERKIVEAGGTLP